MIKTSFLTIAMLGIVISGFSQNEDSGFKPNGKPFIKVYSNYHTSFAGGRPAPAFEITRAYFGYKFSLSEQISGKLNIDVGNPGVGKLQMTAFLKNAYLKYKADNLTVQFGMIPTLQFKVEEGIWGYRYLKKTFADQYKLGASADLGVSVAYKFAGFLSADMSVVNGEGYKKLQNDSALRTSVAITVTPVRNLTLRGYYDFMGQDATQSSLAAFVGYTGKKLITGASYNLQSNNGMDKGHSLSGVSLFITVVPSKKTKLLVRYDKLSSNKTAGAANAWNLPNDGQLFIAGCEYNPVKGLKLTPNFQSWDPADAAKPSVTSLFLNCELKF
ncbi:phosphate-selective porin O and P [hydrothermal vent metagenome]|uniref:Phosphate-selective porin O and P n=1 Tax=hydrothermal vent metagenome TaxID=652676 RepID=A0A3B0UBG1_9ZZZZ